MNSDPPKRKYCVNVLWITGGVHDIKSCIVWHYLILKNGPLINIIYSQSAQLLSYNSSSTHSLVRHQLLTFVVVAVVGLQHRCCACVMLYSNCTPTTWLNSFYKVICGQWHNYAHCWADVLANSSFGKILLAMQTLCGLYQYIKYKSINVTCKVCFGHRLPNRSRRKFLFKQLISGGAWLCGLSCPLPLVRAPETNCLMSRHGPVCGVMVRRYQGLSRPGRTNGAQMRWWSLHRVPSFRPGQGGSSGECSVQEGTEILRIVDLQTAKKSAVIMKLSVANPSHCCGWGGDKSKHRTTALQQYITLMQIAALSDWLF